MSKFGGKTVLLLEDTALAAWEIEDELHDAGYEVAGSFSSCARAEQWLEKNTPDAAILPVAISCGPEARGTGRSIPLRRSIGVQAD